MRHLPYVPGGVLMALAPGTLGCVGTHNRVGRQARHFFRIASHRTLSATGRVAAPEPSRPGRRGLVLLDMWRDRSPPDLGGQTRSATGALPNREAGFRVV
jgi:hypothetical protein